jgi:hypothetical protein
LKEVDDESPIIINSVQQQKNQKAQIPVREAFPKIVYLNGKTEANPLAINELHANTSSQTSIELQLNRQSNMVYYWTFTLGAGDGRGGKNRTSYFRDTPGVFNSRNTQNDIENEN